MKKILFLFLLLSLIGFRSFFAPQVFAQGYTGVCSSIGSEWSNFAASGIPPTIPESYSASININFTGLPEGDYTVQCLTEDCGWFGMSCPGYRSPQSLGTLSIDGSGAQQLSISNSECWKEESRNHIISLVYDNTGNYCRVAAVDVVPLENSLACNLDSFDFYTAGFNNLSEGESLTQGCFEKGDLIRFRGQITSNGSPIANFERKLFYGRYTPDNQKVLLETLQFPLQITDSEGYFNITIDTSDSRFVAGDRVYAEIRALCEYRSEFVLQGSGACTDKQREEEPETTGSSEFSEFSICGQLIAASPERLACEACRSATDGKGIWTAVGCFSGEPGTLVATIIKLGLNIGGGIALIMILVAGFMFTTSQGDPKKTQEAKELMTSAVIGLLFIIFSVTILQFIGVSILQIPGFASER